MVHLTYWQCFQSEVHACTCVSDMSCKLNQLNENWDLEWFRWCLGIVFGTPGAICDTDSFGTTVNIPIDSSRRNTDMRNSTSISWIRFILSSCFSCKKKTSGERSQICLDLQNYKPSWTSIEGTWYNTSILFEMGSTPAIDAPLDSSSYHHSYGLAISVSGSWNANVLLGSKNSCFNSRHNSFQALLQLLEK